MQNLFIVSEKKSKFTYIKMSVILSTTCYYLTVTSPFWRVTKTGKEKHDVSVVLSQSTL